MSNLSDSLDVEYAAAWKPQPNEKLVGVISELSEREGYDGGVYPIVTIRTEDGREFAFHAFHTVAQNELARLRPAVGDQIGIKYLGKVQKEDGRSSYHGYRVRTLGGQPVALNWGKYENGDAPAHPDVPIPEVTVPKLNDVPKLQDDEDVPF